MRLKKTLRAPKTTIGRAFSSSYITSGVSFEEAVQNKAHQLQQIHPQQAVVAGPHTIKQPKAPTPPKWQETGVSTSSNCKQFASEPEQHVQGSNCSAADYDSVQWCCVRKKKYCPLQTN
jgi:hypothetical protein